MLADSNRAIGNRRTSRGVGGNLDAVRNSATSPLARNFKDRLVGLLSQDRAWSYKTCRGVSDEAREGQRHGPDDDHRRLDDGGFSSRGLGPREDRPARSARAGPSAAAAEMVARSVRAGGVRQLRRL